MTDPAYSYLDDLDKIYTLDGEYGYIRKYENLVLKPAFDVNNGISSPSYYHPLLKDAIPFNTDPEGGYEVVVKRTGDNVGISN